MLSTSAPVAARRDVNARPSPAVSVVGALVALACVGFAVVNIAFEMADSFASPTYSEYAAEYPVGFAVMNWLVVALKLVGAVVAMLTIGRSPRFLRPGVVGVMAWAAFVTLGVYALGSVVEAVAMLAGVWGSPDQVDLSGVLYVAFFLAFAAGFGVLATSYARRHQLPKRLIAVGAVGGPMVLGLVLFAVPSVLASAGLLPSA